jgi:hypothetical protein
VKSPSDSSRRRREFDTRPPVRIRNPGDCCSCPTWSSARRSVLYCTQRASPALVVISTTPKTAAGSDRRWEADGVVERQVKEQQPIRVEYGLTDDGEALAPAIEALRERQAQSPVL